MKRDLNEDFQYVEIIMVGPFHATLSWGADCVSVENLNPHLISPWDFFLFYGHRHSFFLGDFRRCHVGIIFQSSITWAVVYNWHPGLFHLDYGRGFIDTVMISYPNIRRIITYLNILVHCLKSLPQYFSSLTYNCQKQLHALFVILHTVEEVKICQSQGSLTWFIHSFFLAFSRHSWIDIRRRQEMVK